MVSAPPNVYGRLRSVTSAGTLIEQILYDGFDHVKEHKALKEGSATEYNTTQYAYDPVDRTTQKISKAGTPDSKTTDFAYLGLSEEVLMELENAQVVKSYQYSPTGKRLAMINHKDTGDQTSYYGYNTHTDVEMLYKPDGSVEGTYGYTAYGKEDEAATTGVDAPDPADNPDPNYDPEDPVNDYRYSAKRWDPASKSYDMGFRDYSPGLNRFTSLDMYNGALADMGLSTSPWTNNRYAFTGGNPISNVELDGHIFPLVFAAGFALSATDTALIVGAAATAAAAPVLADEDARESIGQGIEAVGDSLKAAWDKTVAFFSSLSSSASTAAEEEENSKKEQYYTFYHGTNSIGAESILQNGIDLSRIRANTDFGRGFYVTNDKDQAIDWANIQSKRHGGNATLLTFKVPKSQMDRLRGLKLSEGEQLDEFIAMNRRNRRYGPLLHAYDYVEGPMLMNLKGWRQGADPVYDGHQISFHSRAGVSVLWSGYQGTESW